MIGLAPVVLSGALCLTTLFITASNRHHFDPTTFRNSIEHFSGIA
jgi:hypothetical protein